MQIYMIGDRSFQLSDDEYLLNRSEWQQDFAKAVAYRNGIKWSDEAGQWVGHAQAFYSKFNITPIDSTFAAYCQKNSLDYAKMVLVFGNTNTLSKVSGLPRYRGCGCGR